MGARANLRTSLLISVFLLAMVGTAAQAVVIDWVAVGDPCNTADTEVMNDGTTGYGSVSYVYRIGKYEITNSQYCEFLNAVARADTYGLYNPNMAHGVWSSGGIARGGSHGTYTYSVRPGRGNNPVNYVSWYDSLRFANWLHNGQPTGGQNSSTTEDGAYTFSGAESVSERNAVAQVFIPSEDEWYKAAYYEGGGADAGYWDYATQSDMPPTLEAPPGGNNSANAGPAPAGGHGLTDVGAYVASVGAYGTYDQNGNLTEWDETRYGPNQWCIRGGAWDMNLIAMAAHHRGRNHTAYLESWNIGFRVASVREPPAIYYVDADAWGANNGSSWVNAFNDLQDALAVALTGDEIRVAQGVYKPAGFIPPPPPPPPPPPGSSSSEQATAVLIDRTATFQLKNGVTIKGGYAGFGEPDPTARDIEAYETILSGDIGTPDDNLDNSYHVITGSGTDATAVLDGFTITAGNANGSGSYEDGGGMYNYVGRPTVTNCTFSANSAGNGGAVFSIGPPPPSMPPGSPIPAPRGGPTITNCTISGNSASAGGGIYNVYITLMLSNCIFSGNSASVVGGGMCSHYKTHGWLINCTFTGNSALNGNALACDSSSQRYSSDLQLSNCILWDGGNEIWNNDNSVITITYSDVQGGWPGEGNIDADPCFVQPKDFGAIAYWKFEEGSGTTAYDSAGDNHGTVYGAQWTSGQLGGALGFDGINDYVDLGYTDLFSGWKYVTIEFWAKPEYDPDMTWPVVLAKWSGLTSYPYEAPAVGIYSPDRVWFWEITTEVGQNVYEYSSVSVNYGQWQHIAYVFDFADNEVKLYKNGVIAESWNVDIGQCMRSVTSTGAIGHVLRGWQLGGWTPFRGSIDEAVIYDMVLSADEIQQHCQNGLSGQGYPTMANYHLLPGSPCIDAGDNNSVPSDMADLDDDGDTSEPIPFDLDGNPRIVGAVVDMGAYEFQNTAPVSDAGPDQVVECACNTGESTKVTLDGTGSYDVDGDPLTYTWTGPFVESPAHGATPTVTLDGGCPGDYVITLVVNDGIEDSEPNKVVITVVDTIPPEFQFSVTPTVLWPPTHKMVLITPTCTVSDRCDAAPEVSLVSISINEGDTKGDGNTDDDIQIDDDGSIYLSAERSGAGNDRVYSITYQAVDDCGNATVSSATVTVPHDRR